MAQFLVGIVVVGIIVLALFAARNVYYGIQDRIREKQEREADRRRAAEEFVKKIPSMSQHDLLNASIRGDISIEDFMRHSLARRASSSRKVHRDDR